ncbi:MAG TPA: U32 family peptidase [Bacteroidales bacterium]|nr:U32 family peptidase [Bacteroidales bacterium]
MIKLELLAPAKDLEHGQAAINHGADAVYTGAPRFSARKAAGTSLLQIEELARYAHFYRSKVYVALNTILYDHELDEAQKIIKDIYEAGADALIIQDMGILEMELPPIPLFASTQTHNTTPEKVLFLEKAGFKRVILARELSVTQINNIRQHTTVDLESFVHGALCVSYSGQCYMSQSVCQRSGNRGDCSQPCRSSYDLTDASGKIILKNKHLLSLKDLNLSGHLPELIEAGITSFKIEGRLKDMAYVKNIVSHYRKTIDNLIEGRHEYAKASSGVVSFNFMSDPEKTFNRGYTIYNIHERNDKLATIHSQKSVGTKVGEIKKISGNKLFYEGEPLHPGDGVCFFTKENELKGFLVNRFEHGTITPSNMECVHEGAILFRNFNIAFENQLKQSPGNRKIPIDMIFRGDEHQIHLSLNDKEGNQVEVTEQLPGTCANDPEKTALLLKNQLSKLGNSPFLLDILTFDLTTIPFVQTSIINGLRRKATDLLIEKRQSTYARELNETVPNNYPFPEKHPDYRANISNRLAEQFYRRHGVESIEPAYEINKAVKEEIVMETKHCIRYQLDACLKEKTNNLKGELYLKDQNSRYLLRFNCKDCVMQIVKCKPSSRTPS